MGRGFYFLLTALMLLPVAVPARDAGGAKGRSNEIFCGTGGFSGHLQGIAGDESGIYWSFYDTVLKTDWKGREIASTSIPVHAGDLCLHDGKLYISVCYRDRKRIVAEGGSGWVYLLDTALKPLGKRALPETPRPDGITFHQGKFYIGGDDFGHDLHPSNTVSIYDANFKFLRKVRVDTGAPTRYGVQTLTSFGDRILAGFYSSGKPSVFLYGENLTPRECFPFSVSTGILRVPEKLAGNNDTYAISRNVGTARNWSAKLQVFRCENGKLVPAVLPVR